MEFLKRDKDISYQEEFHYIKITLIETINIFGSHIKNAALSKFKGITL